MPEFVPLVDTLRGGTLECRHFGAVAVCDARGRVLAHAGDPHWLSFTRSTLKPFQALPFVQAGGPAHFGFGERQLALLCASHSGEPMHVQVVQGMLASAGLEHRVLQCGCHVPIYVGDGVGPAPEQVDERHHNCSGKHAGFLAWCVQQGHPLDSYLDPGHPLQQAVRHAVARVAGLPAEQMRSGTDGCSAPNYALPLSSLARAYARLASGDADGEFGASFGPLAQAMRAHPELVSGTGRSDLAFMQAGRGDWVSKGGADGVQAIASISRGEAIAVKVTDGSKLAVTAATVAAMDQLGWLDERQREQLRPWLAEVVRSVRGAPVGERRAVFRLQRGG
ncbi:asparaginase [Ramlibacter sp.]|uniref:asparaginase n=1 Tax=Ramlibacter sp. TaxID=1917967 RepID=UPI002D405D52|nr:asparaginase [Ramlibacter sp.]HYD75198.1 asparaginase [Ramlibacter sp.]